MQLPIVLRPHLETREPASTVRAVEQEARGQSWRPTKSHGSLLDLSGLCQKTVMSLLFLSHRQTDL